LAAEAGLAVLRLAPEKFWVFSEALFKEQQSFWDVPVVKESRNQTYARLGEIGAAVGVNKSEIMELLTVPDVGNEIDGLETSVSETVTQNYAMW
jgi:hypothetical protein